MPKLLLPIVAVLAVGGSAAGAGVYLASGDQPVEEVVRPEVLQPSPTTSPQATALPTPAVAGQLWRWVNVTVVIPDGLGLFVNPTAYPAEIKPPKGGPVLELRRYRFVNGSSLISSVLVDAENGVILAEDVRDEDRAVMDAIFMTMTVGPLDHATAPWPYNGEPTPDLPRERFENSSYIRPSVATGLHVYGGIGDPGAVAFVALKNGRSVAFVSVDAATRELKEDTSNVLPEDLPVFDGWLATFRPCGTETPC